MANSPGITDACKQDMLTGLLDLDNDAFKIALIEATGSIGPTTATFDNANEVGASGSYVAGGLAITNGTVAIDTGESPDVAYWQPTVAPSWTAFTNAAGFDCATLYNTTNADATVAIFTFASQTPSNATFTLTLPTNDGATALIRVQ